MAVRRDGGGSDIGTLGGRAWKYVLFAGFLPIVLYFHLKLGAGVTSGIQVND